MRLYIKANNRKVAYLNYFKRLWVSKERQCQKMSRQLLANITYCYKNLKALYENVTIQYYLIFYTKLCVVSRDSTRMLMLSLKHTQINFQKMPSLDLQWKFTLKNWVTLRDYLCTPTEIRKSRRDDLKQKWSEIQTTLPHILLSKTVEHTLL